MEPHIFVLLFLATCPLTVEALRDLWTTHHLEWPIDSFEAFIERLREHHGGYIARNGKGQMELTAEGAAHLRAALLLPSLCHKVVCVSQAADGAYRPVASVREEYEKSWVKGALVTLVEKGILVDDDGQPPDVSDHLCEPPAEG